MTTIRILTLLLILIIVPQKGEGEDILDEPEIFGTARLILFEAGRAVPLAGVDVHVGPVKVGTTNEDGRLTIELYAGIYHFTVTGPDLEAREFAFRIYPEEVIEVIAEVDIRSEDVTLSIERNADEKAVARQNTENAVMSTIIGWVLNEETKEPYVGARIFIRGLPIEVQTDETGRFEIEVPVGTHDIVAVHAEFGTETRSGIEVKEGESAEVTIETAASGVSLEEFTVTEPRIEGATVDQFEERQEANTVTDIIGAEQMSKSGDSDAAGALKRVPGVTIVDGKFVYVRGLGDRYSSTMLNGFRLPSPDPERRVVPLDMFPVGILDSMTIQKTYSPEMPGEFGGGVVNLRTKGFPDKGFLKIDVTGGIAVGSTFTKRDFGTDRGKTDFLGIDQGHRKMPTKLRKATAEGPLEEGDMFNPEGFSRDELTKISQSLDNNWGLEEKVLPVDGGLTITGGHSLKTKKAKLGFMSSLLYKNEWDAVDTKVNDYTAAIAEDGSTLLNKKNDYQFSNVTNKVTLGGILVLGADLGEKQSITSNTLVDRISDNDVWNYEGLSPDANGEIRVYNFEWKERMLFTQQILGSHEIVPSLGLTLDWRYAFAQASRIEPDVRKFRYDWSEVDEMWAVTSHNDGTARDWITVDDKAHDIGWDLILPFHQWTGEEGTVSAGGSVLLKNREVDIRRFAYKGIDELDIEKRRILPPEDFFEDKVVSGNEGIRIKETTVATDNYQGEQETFAGYLASNLPLGAGFKATGGIRFESSLQDVTTFQRFTEDDKTVNKKIDTMDYLPAAGVTYEFWKDMLVRVGYGKTVNRPDFREMSPGCAKAYSGGTQICGAPDQITNPEYDAANPDPNIPIKIDYHLHRAEIHNVDLRWEWYPTSVESISFGGFYKYFVQPLERLRLPGTGAKQDVLYNQKGAQNYGLEFDSRKNFGFVKSELEDLYMAGNFTYVRSRIDLIELPEATQTSKTRPLQGQSPFIVNAQVGYDNVDLGLSIVLLYNVFGKRIMSVGTEGAPDIYEQPFHQLDFVVKHKFKNGLGIGFKAKNIVDANVRFTQGEETTRRFKKGRHLSLSLSYQY